MTKHTCDHRPCTVEQVRHPATNVAQASSMTRSRNSPPLVVPVALDRQASFRQLVLDWQRSCDSRETLFWKEPHNFSRTFKVCSVALCFLHNPASVAMSIVDCLRWQTFSTVQDESWSTEAKSGVPRYDGDVAKLAEYQFRVRLRQAREKAMDESELQKLGPLALRLVDGLRGPALQVARGLPLTNSPKKRARPSSEGTTSDLQPRSKQEARDLYQVGAQSGGVFEPADRRKHSKLCPSSQGLVQLDVGHGRLVEVAGRHTG